jgi:hypothetical protein
MSAKPRYANVPGRPLWADWLREARDEWLRNEHTKLRAFPAVKAWHAYSRHHAYPMLFVQHHARLYRATLLEAGA